MTQKAKTTQLEYFDADALKELVEGARSLLKLDFSYLLAAGAIVTALKLEGSSLIEFGDNQSAIAFVFGAIMAYDVGVERAILSDWMAAKVNSSKRIRFRVISWLVTAQRMIHFGFVLALLSGALGFARGYMEPLNQLKAEVAIQEGLDKFIATKKRLPVDINELARSNKSVSNQLGVIPANQIRIEAVAPEKYRLVFAGNDKALGTDDDDVIEPGQHARRVLYCMYHADSDKCATPP